MSEDGERIGLSCGVCSSLSQVSSDMTDVGPSKSFSLSNCPWRILPMCVCVNGRPLLRMASSAITEGSGEPENVISISSKLPGMLDMFHRTGVSLVDQSPRWSPVGWQGRDGIKSEIVRWFHALRCAGRVHMQVDAFARPDVWHQPVGFERAQHNEYLVAVIFTGENPLDRSKILIHSPSSGLRLDRLAEVHRCQDKWTPNVCIASCCRALFERCKDGKKSAARV